MAGIDMGKSICRCGHTGDGAGSAHGGLIGHGPCTVEGCGCQKFTWKQYTPEQERRFATDPILARSKRRGEDRG